MPEAHDAPDLITIPRGGRGTPEDPFDHVSRGVVPALRRALAAVDSFAAFRPVHHTAESRELVRDLTRTLEDVNASAPAPTETVHCAACTGTDYLGRPCRGTQRVRP